MTDTADRDRLRQAYLATTYQADTPVGAVAIRIGETAPALGTLLARYGATHWAFITACNPQSTPLPQAENQARQADLQALLRERQYPHFAGQGRGDQGDWPAEPSYLVLGVQPDAALAIARRFGQAAIVIGEAGGAAELVMCD